MENSKRAMSYDTLKAIVGASSWKLRERMHRGIPDLRAMSKRLPYHFDSVYLGETSLEVEQTSWNFFSNFDSEGQLIPDSTHLNYTSAEGNFRREFNGSQETMMGKLIKEYLRDKTIIRKLKFWDLPEKFPTNVRLYVENIEMENHGMKSFDEFKKCLAKDNVVKSFRFIVRNSTMRMFDDDVVKNAVRLNLQFPYYDTVEMSNEALSKLKNKHIYMIHISWPMHNVWTLMGNWIAERRPIGTSLFVSIEDYNYVTSAFDRIQEINEHAYYSKIKHLGDSFFAHSVTVPIDEHSEVVLHGGPMIEVWKPFEWTFRMEIMEKGATERKLNVV